jgi:hypothetical protein
MKLILFALIIVGTSCSSHLKHNNTVQEKLNYDTSKIAIIPFTNSLYWLFDSLRYHSSNLTQEDILEIEKIFNESVSDNNSKLLSEETKKYFTIDLKKMGYKRQYVCVISDNEEKIIFVNCFCKSFTGNDWRRFLLQVDDGGRCYFSLKINLTKKKYFDFFVNGVV